MTAPPLFVTHPTTPRVRWGLIDAADEQVVPEADRKRLSNGIEFEPQCRMNAALDSRECSDQTALTIPGSAQGRPLVQAGPIRIWASFTCNAVALADGQAQTEANAAMANSGPPLLERTLWAPAAEPDPGQAQTNQRFMGPDTTILGSGPVSVVAGIRALEDFLGAEYGRVGVIHAPAGVSADLAAKAQVRWEQGTGKPTTQRGHRYAWGAYPYADPEGAAADAGTAWLVATGAVWLRQNDPAPFPDPMRTVNLENNTVLALAVKTYVVAWECVTAAVQVTLET